MTSPSHHVRVREMTADDLEWARMLADGTPEAPHWPANAYAGAIAPDSPPRRVAMVAEHPLDAGSGGSGPRAGFAIASLIPPQSELETIVVSATARRAGIGGALMASLLASLKSANVTEVTLEVRASNLPAAGFYRATGFVESGRRNRYYIDPVEDAMLMICRIG